MFNMLVLGVLNVIVFWGVGRFVLSCFKSNLEQNLFGKLVLSLIVGLLASWMFLILMSLTFFWIPIFYFIVCTIFVYYFFYIGMIKFNNEIKQILLLISLFCMFVAICGFLFKNLIIPEFRWDGLAGHIPVVKSLLSDERAKVLWYHRNPIFPINAEILMAINGYFGIQYIKLTSFVALFIICLVALFEINQFKVSLICKIASSLFFIVTIISTEIFFNFAISAYIDVILSMSCFISIVMCKNYLVSRNRIYLVTGLIAYSIAAGIKYPTLIFLPIIVIPIYFCFRWKERYRYWIIFSSICLGCIWFVRNVYYTGNPVWPFASKIFGISRDIIWSSGDYVGQFADLTKYGATLNSITDILYSMSVNHVGEGNGFPVWFWCLFIIVPVILAIKKIISKKSSADIDFSYTIFYHVSFMIFFIGWLCSVPNIRYLLPALPILLLICCVAVMYLIRCSIVMSLLLMVYLSFVWYQFSEQQKNIYMYLDSHQVTQSVPVINIGQYLQPNKSYYGLLSGGAELNTYSSSIVYGDWFGKYRFGDFLKACPDMTKAELKMMGMDGLIVESGFIDNKCYERCIVQRGKSLFYGNKNYCILK